MNLGLQTWSKFKLSVRTETKGDLRDFGQTSLRFAENGSKKRKYPERGGSVGENALLMPEVTAERPDWLELIKRQQGVKHPGVPAEVCRGAPLNARHVQPGGRWAAAGKCAAPA